MSKDYPIFVYKKIQSQNVVHEKNDKSILKLFSNCYLCLWNFLYNDLGSKVIVLKVALTTTTRRHKRRLSFFCKFNDFFFLLKYRLNFVGTASTNAFLFARNFSLLSHFRSWKQFLSEATFQSWVPYKFWFLILTLQSLISC